MVRPTFPQPFALRPKAAFWRQVGGRRPGSLLSPPSAASATGPRSLRRPARPLSWSSPAPFAIRTSAEKSKRLRFCSMLRDEVGRCLFDIAQNATVGAIRA
jgi:hypothetical protein